MSTAESERLLRNATPSERMQASSRHSDPMATMTSFVSNAAGSSTLHDERGQGRHDRHEGTI
jgi:hypothetical protein